MKLYYVPGACSLAPHIALCEAGMKFELAPVNLREHKLPDGTDYYTLNPKGQVPLLELDDGQRLSENSAILQYVADHAPASGLAPAAGTMARYRLIEWLGFVGSDVHKGLAMLFNPALPAEAKASLIQLLMARLAFVDRELASRDYLTGDRFCVVDGYLFTVLGWAPRLGVDLSALKNVEAYRARIAERPAVRQAMKAEGLLK